MNTNLDPRVVTPFESLMAMKMKSKGFRLPPTSKIISKLSGTRLSKYRGRGLNFEEFRHYQMGDDIRSIDWQVTQRTGDPHVRVYSEERDLSVVLFIDQRTSMFFSSVDTMKSVVAAHIAACCAWKITSDSDRVGALIFNDEGMSWYKPQRNPAHVSRILRTLTKANEDLSHANCSQISHSQPFSNLQSGFSKGLNKLTKLKLKGSLVVMISDFAGVNEQDINAIKWLKRHNDVLGVAINDPMELDLSFRQSMHISDGHSQLPVGPELNSKLASYNQSTRSDRSQVHSMIRAGGVGVIELDTSGNHLHQFLEQVSGKPYVSK
ncbi:DUF58 domain-containing protein [Vibrio makurazakiensis]|uniref:DUF58 domain-containing protein n=1 Tax=Vibrio makurazakiensis TaxID=2910250 RepID=UPI003D0BFE7D